MQLNEYQQQAGNTAIYPDRGNNLIYPVLGLAGEGGEVCEKTKKIIRDNGGFISPEFKEDIKKELGDVLWYIAAICHELNLDMNDVAQTNLDKLASRQQRNKLHGSGDDR